MASVIMPVTFVKIHSVGSLILKDTSLYIEASVVMPVMFVKLYSVGSLILKSPANT
jgi:hypothetical protein